ncbi:hypothetical protein F4809DRAFT_626305 [Biscogniauxia mediterranea]|nr:hypothetical protein F4809DRAFT_626305 [Biscogniauxia mediterranea]
MAAQAQAEPASLPSSPRSSSASPLPTGRTPASCATTASRSGTGRCAPSCAWAASPALGSTKSGSSLPQTKAMTTPVICIEANVRRTLFRSSVLDPDCLTREMTDDKSKGGLVYKSRCVLAGGVIRVGSASGGWAYGLPLELATVGYAIYVLIVYLMWWSKPVRRFHAYRAYCELSEPGPRPYLYGLKVETWPSWRKVLDLKLPDVNEIRRVPETYSVTGGLRPELCMYPVLLSSTLFAGVHFSLLRFIINKIS